ncbi:MAG: GTPase HflX [Rhodothalassiaceae bacterium]
MSEAVSDDRAPDAVAPSADGAAACVLHPWLKTARLSHAGRSPSARLEEAVGLARAIDVRVALAMEVPLAAYRPATLIGSGKLAQIGERIADSEIGLIIVDADLTPVQQRNLERFFKTKVIDRTGLILEIFGARARTKEGELQVELAHLTYQRSRLVRSWTHLERQRGGFGFLGGPGETQIEADRRAISDRIAQLRRQLEQVRRTRGLHRARRKKAPWPVVALVGYTNAGKSTLFNRLTRAETMAADMLFATLDPTMRAIDLSDGLKIILSDTVGFISDLPTHLIAAFRATLEEVTEADLIVHVRDAAHPDCAAQKADVIGVLEALGIADHADGGVPVIEAMNKIDLLDANERAELEARAARDPDLLAISAVTGDGLDSLVAEIRARLDMRTHEERVTLGPEEGARIAWLYRHGAVLESRVLADGSTSLRVRLSEVDAARFHGIS